MTDLVDRVAKAICLARFNAGTAFWYMREEESKEPYRAEARAAIAAMREPTEGMIDAFHTAAYLRVEWGEDPMVENSEDAYRAMIDAALNTGGRDGDE
jgi:hypothetical protein